MSEQKRRVQIFIPPDMYDRWKQLADDKAVPLSHWVIACVQNAGRISPVIQQINQKLDLLLENRETP